MKGEVVVEGVVVVAEDTVREGCGVSETSTSVVMTKVGVGGIDGGG